MILLLMKEKSRNSTEPRRGLFFIVVLQGRNFFCFAYILEMLQGNDEISLIAPVLAGHVVGPPDPFLQLTHLFRLNSARFLKFAMIKTCVIYAYP